MPDVSGVICERPHEDLNDGSRFGSFTVSMMGSNAFLMAPGGIWQQYDLFLTIVDVTLTADQGSCPGGYPAHAVHDSPLIAKLEAAVVLPVSKHDARRDEMVHIMHNVNSASSTCPCASTSVANYQAQKSLQVAHLIVRVQTRAMERNEEAK